jgi:hypothetical protein
MKATLKYLREGNIFTVQEILLQFANHSLNSYMILLTYVRNFNSCINMYLMNKPRANID